MSKNTLDELSAPIAPPEEAEPATAANPAAPVPEADGPSDILDFDFDDFGGSMGDSVADLMVEEPPAAPPAAPEPAPEPALPEILPENSSEPENPEEKPSSPSDLREQVIAANERARQAQAAKEETERELEAARQEREEIQAKLQTTNDAVARAEASSHPSVQAITSPFEQKLRDMAENMIGDGGDGGKLLQLAPQLISDRMAIGSPDSEGFVERRDAFLAQLDNNFPDDRKQIAALITEGARVTQQAEQQVAAVVADAEKFRYDSALTQHQDAVRAYDEIEKTFGSVPPEIRESDPDDHRVILENLMNEVPQLKERGDLVRKHLRRVNLPLAPIDPAQLAAMSPEDQAAHMEERVARYENDRLTNVANSWNNYMWAAAGPMLYKIVQNLRTRAGDEARSTPAPRENAAENVPQPEAESLSPADFQPVNPEL